MTPALAHREQITINEEHERATMNLHLTHHRIALVKESAGTYPATPPVINNPHDAATVLFNVAKVHEEPQEVFGIVAVNTKMRVLAVQEISIGILDRSLVHPRETFRAAILHNAAAIILYHNHPSGDLTPSKDDISTTERLKNAGELLGIDILDHIITGPNENYLSFREQGLL